MKAKAADPRLCSQLHLRAVFVRKLHAGSRQDSIFLPVSSTRTKRTSVEGPYHATLSFLEAPAKALRDTGLTISNVILCIDSLGATLPGVLGHGDVVFATGQARVPLQCQFQGCHQRFFRQEAAPISNPSSTMVRY
jgi:hypothetical protein